MQLQNNDKLRVYLKSECIVFSKTNEKFGGLSNMAPGYPLFVNDNIISNSEVLYQVMRYPLFPDIQYEIISQNSPMTAKMISKKYHDKTRQDWDSIRVKIMRWCLEVKLCQNWEKFGELLRETEGKPIVEYSVKDKFWGASSSNDRELSGTNALGRLLMELRGKYVHPNKLLQKVEPLNITGFLLYGCEVGMIHNKAVYANDFETELECT